jgi:hypothetical protein
MSQESGLYEKWTAMAQEARSYYSQQFYKNREEIYQSETLTLTRLRSAFVLLLFGLFFSTLLFNIEYFVNESNIGTDSREI